MIFMDSYGLVEFSLDTGSYNRYENELFCTTFLNLYEMAAVLIRSGREDIAKAAFEKFKTNIVQVPELIYYAAAILKVSHRHLSNVDCIGYLVAQSKGIPFVTGDDGFKGFPNVIIQK